MGVVEVGAGGSTGASDGTEEGTRCGIRDVGYGMRDGGDVM